MPQVAQRKSILRYNLRTRLFTVGAIGPVLSKRTRRPCGQQAAEMSISFRFFVWPSRRGAMIYGDGSREAVRRIYTCNPAKAETSLSKFMQLNAIDALLLLHSHHH
eukprot:3901144-Pleurochrysis_carterae.AAC.2